jgi:hypothetical protein
MTPTVICCGVLLTVSFSNHKSDEMESTIELMALAATRATRDGTGIDGVTHCDLVGDLDA